MSKFHQWVQTIVGRKKTDSSADGAPPTQTTTPRESVSAEPPPELLARLRQFAASSNARFSPKWLAAKFNETEIELLDALAYSLRDGSVELHWEVFCPVCAQRPADYDSLSEATSEITCTACGNIFDLHLDRDVRVTFSASENLRRENPIQKSALAFEETADQPPTRGLDLLLSPAFRKFFSGEAPALNESLKIGRVAILFTDLRGSTAIYAERGDPKAYKMVREHFDILQAAIERHQGALVKTIGDSVMASFATGAEAVAAAFEAQAALQARVEQIGGELILKAGVHAGTCLAVNLNGQLDFFGGAVNTAARVQGLSNGNDVVVTDEVFAETNHAAAPFLEIENFDSKLRGLPDAVHVRRLIAAVSAINLINQ